VEFGFEEDAALAPAGRPFFERLGFAAASHGRAALYLRPHRIG
jgi:hypothetical protein